MKSRYQKYSREWWIDEWCKALESGEFVQGTSRLTTIIGNVEYDCCMGVACKVAMKYAPELVTVEDYNLAQGHLERYKRYNRQGDYLPSEVRGLMNIHSSNPFVIYKGLSLALSTLNDHEKLSFTQIAKLIRGTYEVPRLPLKYTVTFTAHFCSPNKCDEKEVELEFASAKDAARVHFKLQENQFRLPCVFSFKNWVKTKNY